MKGAPGAAPDIDLLSALGHLTQRACVDQGLIASDPTLQVFGMFGSTRTWGNVCSCFKVLASLYSIPPPHLLIHVSI